MEFIPLSIREVLSSPPPKLTHVLPGLLRGHVGVLCGTGGTGKTTLAQQIAVSLACGIPTAGRLFAAPPEPMPVALVTAEEPKDVIITRLHAMVDALLAEEPYPLFPALARDEIVERLERNLQVFPCSGQDIRLIREGAHTMTRKKLSAAIKGCHLLILETVSRLHDGDENSASDMTALVNALESIAVEVECALVAIHHTSKSATLNNPSSQHASRGSSALTDNVRWQANLYGVHPEELSDLGLEHMHKRLLRFEITKANYVPPQDSVLLLRSTGGVMATLEKPTAKGGRARASRRR